MEEIMDSQHSIQRWFVIVTVIICLGLAILFGVLQAGIF